MCEDSCTRKTALKIHIDAIHEGLKPHKCSICDYACGKRSRLEYHINAVHEGKKPHTCSICDYSCATKSNLNRHLIVVHEGKIHTTTKDILQQHISAVWMKETLQVLLEFLMLVAVLHEEKKLFKCSRFNQSLITNIIFEILLKIK